MTSGLLTLRTGAASHPGLHRPTNQDSWYAGDHLVVVADGVGGVAGGEVASAAVIAAIAPCDTPDEGGDRWTGLRAALAEATARIARAAGADPALSGMGSTLTALRFTGGQVQVLHVGDSRAYRLRAAELVRLTTDDTYVQHLVEQGLLAAEDAETHPHRHMVTRVVSADPVEPSQALAEVRAGDRYLVCSDGLTDAVPTDEVAEVLRAGPTPESCATELVERALRAGGPDNVTVLVTDVVPAPPRRRGPRNWWRRGRSADTTPTTELQ